MLPPLKYPPLSHPCQFMATLTLRQLPINTSKLRQLSKLYLTCPAHLATPAPDLPAQQTLQTLSPQQTLPAKHALPQQLKTLQTLPLQANSICPACLATTAPDSASSTNCQLSKLCHPARLAKQASDSASSANSASSAHSANPIQQPTVCSPATPNSSVYPAATVNTQRWVCWLAA